MRTAMPESTSPRPDDFREQLSAWHDGALPNDAARFVSRRLLNDEALRAEVGRWQVIGDALRRQPQQQTSRTSSRCLTVPICSPATRSTRLRL
jgi:anti-sigma-K factor RskA